MGKSCVRFKKIEDVPLSVIGQAIKRVPVKKFIARYESIIKSAGNRRGKTGTKKKGTATRAKKTTTGRSISRRTT